MSAISFASGVYSESLETNKMMQAYSDLVESNHNEILGDLRTELNILISLKNLESSIAENILEMKVRKALKLVKEIGIKPSSTIIKNAKSYQSKYCSDNCLGFNK